MAYEVPVIVVNQTHPLERRRLTLAHELAHSLIDEQSAVDLEKAANYFAGAFLVPAAHLAREMGKQRRGLGYSELIQLKRMYRVSAAAFLMRLRRTQAICPHDGTGPLPSLGDARHQQWQAIAYE
jgi:Zn-dependent peptidase ImmA (M78 family)